MRIAFACPSYGPIDAKVVHMQRYAIMMAWANGIEVHGDSWIDRAGWDQARNSLVSGFLKSEGFDGIFWCDADTVLTPDAIVNLVAPGKDVMTGIYYGRHPPFEPQIHVFNEHAQAWNRILKWPTDGSLFPVHGHGFGCVYTSRKALEATHQVDFDGPPAVSEDGVVTPAERHWWFRTGQWGEDLTWCHYARKMGIVLWCNPNVVVGHLGQTEEIGHSRFEQWYRDNKTESQIFAMTLEQRDGQYEAVVKNGLGSMNGDGKNHSVALDEHLRMTPSA